MARKAKKVFSRKARTGIAAAPTTSFHAFNDYIRVDVDRKEIASVIKTYIRKQLPKEEAQKALAAPEWMYQAKYFLASTIQWKEMEREFPPKWNAQKVLDMISEFVAKGEQKIREKAEEEQPLIPKKSVADLVKERTSLFIGAIEERLDDWENQEKYSLYNEMRKDDVPYVTAKAVVDYYTPLLEEITELVEKKTDDLVEAYGYMKIPTRKKYLQFISSLITDAEKYMATKKAIRKARKPKVKSADKQVQRMNYMKENKEFKLMSVHPSQIVGARRVYLFNTKYRALVELVSDKPQGFEVSGSTIKGIDADASRQVRLRKPEEFLSVVQQKTPLQINKEWSTLTTKTTTNVNGRVNKETIILRALDK